MRELALTYRGEVDSLDSTEWYRLLGGLEDASLYQTPAYAVARYGASRVSHIVVKRDGVVVAAAQCGIFKTPIFNRGIAHLRWGPLWRCRNGPRNLEHFRQAIRALRNEYAIRRGLILRIYPRVFQDEGKECEKVLLEEGFTPWGAGDGDRTLVIDLKRNLEKLRNGMEKRWRRHLKRAEERDLELVEGTDDRFFEDFSTVYKKMLDLKQLKPSNDITRFRRAQGLLPREFKMRVILCREEGEPCAGILASAIGATGMTIFRATNERGRQCEAAYLVHWRALKWLQEAGCTRYDMNGINPVTNPGTYQYKAGLCGRSGEDLSFLGQFETCNREIASALVKKGEQFIRAYRRSRETPFAVRFGKALKRMLDPGRHPEGSPETEEPGRSRSAGR